MTKSRVAADIRDESMTSKEALKNLQLDLQAGRSLQERIRPDSGQILQDILFEHEIRPALHLSGDALDFFPLPDGRLLAYLLDVSGHGAAAALLAMFIKSCVRHSLALLDSPTPGRILQDVNKALLEANTHKFATMVCLIINPADNQLVWSHAGHTPRPILWMDGQARQQSASGQPVGLFAEAEYAEHRLELPPQFAFCLFSDGVLNVLPGNDLLGREASLLHCVAECAGRFAGLADRLLLPAAGQDDRSVFVISRSAS